MTKENTESKPKWDDKWKIDESIEFAKDHMVDDFHPSPLAKKHLIDSLHSCWARTYLQESRINLATGLLNHIAFEHIQNGLIFIVFLFFKKKLKKKNLKKKIKIKNKQKLKKKKKCY